jgi:hypothetical protein
LGVIGDSVPVAPTDSLQGNSIAAGSTVLDFWRWGFADLSDDDVKGFFAEWLVHKLLAVPTLRRVSWANSDVITPAGTRIEVKSTAYWQSWKYLGESGLPLPKPKYRPTDDDKRIRFSGLKARDSTNSDGGIKNRNFKSHFYVFALQNEIDLKRWNALDLAQWEFYWVPVHALRELGSASVSLHTLRQRFDKLSAIDLSIAGRKAIEAFEAHGDVNPSTETPL